MTETPRPPLAITLAIWRRALAEAIWLLVGCVVVIFAFHWLDIYFSSFISAPAFASFFQEMPESMGGMLGVSIAEAITPHGRVGLTFVHPIVVVVAAVWALGRGSDAVSGPLDRGTLELTLAQPVSRMTVLSANIGVTVIGAALIAFGAWLGACAGIHTAMVRLLLDDKSIPLSSLVAGRDFVQSAFNFFSLIVLMSAYTTLISACDRFRWRTLGIAGTFTLLQIIAKLAGLASKKLAWLFYFTILGAYWPQRLALAGEYAWRLSWQYNGILLGLAVACYLAAAIIFARRDLPAPL